MLSFSSCLLAVQALCLTVLTSAQQYAGDVIPNSLPYVPGSEIVYFRITDAKGNHATLTNYYSLGSAGGQLVPANIKRAAIFIHGLDRDPGTYMSNMLTALSQVPNSTVTQDDVAILCPYFADGDDKNYGYPWNSGQKAGRGSNTTAIVYQGSTWASGANNQYPYYPVDMTDISSYAVLDQLVQFFDNKAMFPNMNQIVVAGHSLGAQMVQRYAAVGDELGTSSPVSYYVANPDSLLWFSTSRPLDTSTCSTYDTWRDGFTNYTNTYGTAIVAAGRDAALARYNSRKIAYGRGLLDFGDDASTCAPYTTGANRNERFFNFIRAFPVSCTDPTDPFGACSTIDLVNASHDAGAMMASSAGQARLFLDNFNGDGNMAYDFGCPRIQTGDDPYPNPAGCGNTTNTTTTYAGNMTYAGCWTDNGGLTPALPYTAYRGNTSNTIEGCTSTCASLGYTIAGAEYGAECYCGDSLSYYSTQTVDSGCDMACSGNSSEMCGAASRLSLYSNGTPTQDPLPSVPSTIGAYTYLGCYTEGSAGRALADSSTSGSSMTLESCASFCSGYSYFGTEYADECYCANSLGAGSALTASTDCDMLCAGNDLEYCGAGNRLTLFKRNGTVSSASSTSATSTVVATPTSTALDCDNNASNGTYFNATNGGRYEILCGYDAAGADLSSATTASFELCADLCDSTSGCVDVSYVPGVPDGTCYMKSAVTSFNMASYVWTAMKVSGGDPPASSTTSSSSTTSTASVSTSTALDCTNGASNGETYNTTLSSYYIECGVDYAGGDLSSTTTNSFELCLAACDATSGCIDTSYVPGVPQGTCYMKSSLGTPSSVSYVWTGKKISGSDPPASSTSSSATSTSAAAMSTALSCSNDASNMETYNSTNGISYLIMCATDYGGGDLSSTTTSSFEQCISTCDVTSGCIDVSYVPGSPVGTCYMKSSLGTPGSVSYVWTAKRISLGSSVSSSSTTTAATATPTALTCTNNASNGTTFNATNGGSYLVLCGIDYAGGDLSSTSTSSFAACVDYCDNYSGCIDVSYVSGACYMKSKLTTASAASNVWTAQKISGSSGSSSSSTSSTSAAAATPSVLTCTNSASDGTIYNATNGGQYQVMCFTDYAGGDLSSAGTSGFSECADLCDTTSGCIDVSYVPGANSGACYMKKSLTTASAVSYVWTAKKVLAGVVAAAGSSSSSSQTTMATSVSSSSTSTSSSSSTTSTKPAATLPAGVSYLGCYVDSGTTRALTEELYSNSSNTPEVCALACRQAGYKYAGTEYGSECHCGNTLTASTASSSDCSMTCAGDSSQYCGASWRLSVTVDSTWVQTTFARVNYETWSMMGCYADSTSQRTLNMTMSTLGGENNLTIPNCMDACKAQGYAYCGAEYYGECYGSHTQPSFSLIEPPDGQNDPIDAGCNYPCNGNQTEVCGGSSKVLVYINNGTDASNSTSATVARMFKS